MTVETVFDRETLNSLKVAYAEAVERKEDIFIFRNVELAANYTKYLIEYLEGVLK